MSSQPTICSKRALQRVPKAKNTTTPPYPYQQTQHFTHKQRLVSQSLSSRRKKHHHVFVFVLLCCKLILPPNTFISVSCTNSRCLEIPSRFVSLAHLPGHHLSKRQRTDSDPLPCCYNLLAHIDFDLLSTLDLDIHLDSTRLDSTRDSLFFDYMFNTC